MRRIPFSPLCWFFLIFLVSSALWLYFPPFTRLHEQAHKFGGELFGSTCQIVGAKTECDHPNPLVEKKPFQVFFFAGMPFVLEAVLLGGLYIVVLPLKLVKRKLYRRLLLGLMLLIGTDFILYFLFFLLGLFLDGSFAFFLRQADVTNLFFRSALLDRFLALAFSAVYSLFLVLLMRDFVKEFRKA